MGCAKREYEYYDLKPSGIMNFNTQIPTWSKLNNICIYVGRESDRESTYSREDSNSLATWKEELKKKNWKRVRDMEVRERKKEEDLKWETWTGTKFKREESGHDDMSLVQYQDAWKWMTNNNVDSTWVKKDIIYVSIIGSKIWRIM